MGQVWNVVIFLLGLLAGAGLGAIARHYWLEKRTQNLQEQAKNILNDARKEAETIKKEAILQAK